MKYKVYLSGGIFQLHPDEYKTWRDEATWVLGNMGLETLDPLRRDFAQRGELTSADVLELVNGDKEDIDLADIVLVNAVRPSWGTAMEIFYAATHYTGVFKPEIVAFNVTVPMSPWLLHHTDVRCATLEEALEYIGENYNG